MGNSPSYSLLDDMEFKSSFDNYQAPTQITQEPFISPGTAQSAARGAQSGGLSGALMAGGVNSLLTSGAAAGGPYAIAGGLLLSELEAAQKEKARVEAEKIQNEKDRMANMQSQLNNQSRTVFRV